MKRTRSSTEQTSFQGNGFPPSPLSHPRVISHPGSRSCLSPGRPVCTPRTGAPRSRPGAPRSRYLWVRLLPLPRQRDAPLADGGGQADQLLAAGLAARAVQLGHPVVGDVEPADGEGRRLLVEAVGERGALVVE